MRALTQAIGGTIGNAISSRNEVLAREGIDTKVSLYFFDVHRYNVEMRY